MLKQYCVIRTFGCDIDETRTRYGIFSDEEYEERLMRSSKRPVFVFTAAIWCKNSSMKYQILLSMTIFATNWRPCCRKRTTPKRSPKKSLS